MAKIVMEMQGQDRSKEARIVVEYEESETYSVGDLVRWEEVQMIKGLSELLKVGKKEELVAIDVNRLGMIPRTRSKKS